MKRLLYILLVPLVALSCSKESDPAPDTDDPTGLVGRWQLASSTYERDGNFPVVDLLKEMDERGEDSGCFREMFYVFHKGGKFSIEVPVRCQADLEESDKEAIAGRARWEVVGMDLHLTSGDETIKETFRVEGKELTLTYRQKAAGDWYTMERKFTRR